jgi:hypothetical protein
VAPAVAELPLHLLQAGAGGPWKFERNKETHISIIPICSRNSNSRGRNGLLLWENLWECKRLACIGGGADTRLSRYRVELEAKHQRVFDAMIFS